MKDIAAADHAQLVEYRPPYESQVCTKRPRTIASASARELDQYYTRPHVAAYLCGVATRYFDLERYQMVEPSAGAGSFSDQLPESRWAYDRDPQGERIVQADYLKTVLYSEREIAVIGNPPFGRNAATALRFVNHAATHSSKIAFILPKSFRKASIVDRIDPYFHVIHDEPVELNAFTLGSKIHDVPTVFQIWERRIYRRAPCVVETQHPDFEFTTGDRADFAIQRVGLNAGRVHHDCERSPSAHYFIRGDVEDAMTALNSFFRYVAADAAGNPSLAKSEIVALYREYTETGLRHIRIPPRYDCHR